MANRKTYSSDGSSALLSPLGKQYLSPTGFSPLGSLRLFAGSGGGGVPIGLDRERFTGLEGTYNPLVTPDSYGIPNAALAAGLTPGPAGMLTLTGAGPYVFYRKDIPAFVRVQTTARIEFRECRIYGDNRYFGSTTNGGNTAVINCDSSASRGGANVLITDCEIYGKYPSDKFDGILGHDFTARRNYIHHTTDGIGIRDTGLPDGNINVNVLGNVIGPMVYWTPDYTNGSRANTHNDGIQVYGSRGILIRGNNIQDMAATDAGTPPYGKGTGVNPNTKWFPALNGQAILVQSTIGGTIYATIDRNWLGGGARGLSLVNGVVTATNNVFYTNQGNGGPQIQVQPGTGIDAGNWSGSTTATFTDSWYGNTSTAGGNATVKRVAF